ncbi:MAG: cytochrome family protein [Xanthobacteraceae bacterium]
MNARLALLASLVLLFAAAAGSAGLAQAVPSPPSSGAPAAVPYVMTMGDMMNTLVQPRHAKLGLAGKARNWPLAEYALVEIRQAFTGIVKAQPHFDGLPVGQLVDAAVQQPINAVEAAIHEQDPAKFAAAYAQLTAGCNACHAAVDHPFVVIKAPDVSAFPNQDFSPHQ